MLSEHGNQNPNENEESYIILAMIEHGKNGDTYMSYLDLYELCLRKNKSLSPEAFSADLDVLLADGRVVEEEGRLYLANIFQHEETASHLLAHILTKNNNMLPALFPPRMMPETEALCEEQKSAVSLALRHRLSLILGGAGSGKSTLVSAICRCSQLRNQEIVLCAPTGKAARIMAQKTGRETRTIHSALGIFKNDDFLKSVSWPTIRLVIVDECSLMTLPMFSAILSRLSDSCHVVLVGDCNQLPGVGEGNVIADLLAMGVPHIMLTENHRQDCSACALAYNAMHFANLRRINSLKMDSSFFMIDLDEKAAQDRIVMEAVRRIKQGESVQVLTPLSARANHLLSAKSLNLRIRDAVNPLNKRKKCLMYKGTLYISGDKVMITQNDRDKDVCNGDIGILHILNDEKDHEEYCVELPDGRIPHWSGIDVFPALAKLMLAYALTVHKAQGSEWDSIIIALSMGMQSMLHRNLFYTAITRARRQVMIIGNSLAVDVAMQRNAPKRKSMLVPKTKLCLVGIA